MSVPWVTSWPQRTQYSSLRTWSELVSYGAMKLDHACTDTDYLTFLACNQLCPHLRPLCLLSHAVCVCLVAQSCLTLCNPMDFSLPGSSVCGNCLSKNTRVGCHALLQGILPTQGSNPAFLLCRWILYHLSHQNSPNPSLLEKQIWNLLPYPLAWLPCDLTISLL